MLRAEVTNFSCRLSWNLEDFPRLYRECFMLHGDWIENWWLTSQRTDISKNWYLKKLISQRTVISKNWYLKQLISQRTDMSKNCYLKELISQRTDISKNCYLKELISRRTDISKNWYLKELLSQRTDISKNWYLKGLTSQRTDISKNSSKRDTNCIFRSSAPLNIQNIVCLSVRKAIYKAYVS